MSERAANVATSAVLVTLAAGTCVGSWRLGLGDVHTPGPGFMPFAAAALLGAMALVQLVRQAASPGAGDPPSRPREARRRGTVVIVLATLLGFGAAIGSLGFTISSFGMLLVLFGVVARKPWWVTLAAALSIAVVARLVFRALGVELPGGPLGL
jgi:hypothetical protein